MDRERDSVRKRMEGQRQGRPSPEVERLAPEWRERSVSDSRVYVPATEIPARPVAPPAPPPEGTPPAAPSQALRRALASRSGLRQALLLREILGRPKALRDVDDEP